MPLPRLFVSACLLLLAGCTPAVSGSADQGPGGNSPAPAELTPSGVAVETPADPEIPSPDARLPRDPSLLAERLTRTTRALHAAIDVWREIGGTAEWPPPREIVLLALDQQRINQLLATSDARRDATIRALPPGLRSAARDTSLAASRLADGLRGIVVDTPIAMRTRAPLPPDTLRAHYERAARRFDVPWTLLAAVHFMETKFGRVVSPSWAGAQGPMQFIPSTWDAFGMGGDVHDTRDAIHAAANYLSATGSPENDRQALWAYNPVDYYGDVVLLYERQMRQDVRTFYAFYNWQVFVRTRFGLVQVTGPGADG
jgi:hypothetical protein